LYVFKNCVVKKIKRTFTQWKESKNLNPYFNKSLVCNVGITSMLPILLAHKYAKSQIQEDVKSQFQSNINSYITKRVCMKLTCIDGWTKLPPHKYNFLFNFVQVFTPRIVFLSFFVVEICFLTFTTSLFEIQFFVHHDWKIQPFYLLLCMLVVVVHSFSNILDKEFLLSFTLTPNCGNSPSSMSNTFLTRSFFRIQDGVNASCSFGS